MNPSGIIPGVSGADTPAVDISKAPDSQTAIIKNPADIKAAKKAVRQATTESTIAKVFLTFIALGFLALVLFVPLFVVFAEASRKGWEVYKASLTEPDALAAIKLTLLVAAIAVPLNTLFGLAAAWTISKFRFKGKNVLTTLIDLPFAVSPVISGMIFILIFGREGFLGPFLEARDWKIVFAVPGLVLATAFVTFPFVARELIAFMETQGTHEEEAAVSLGANGFQTFWRVTMPNIKWGLLYGIILCNARAMGEFGAVSVVSGHIRGQTNTLPLQVEILYNEYSFAASFALASLLTLLGLVTLVIKQLVEYRVQLQLKRGQAE